MIPDLQCRWCPERLADCPDPVLHERYHRQSESTWRLAAAVLTPDHPDLPQPTPVEATP